MAPPLPRVSAIVAAYNYGAFLPRTLDSALAQDYPAELLEIVVVDDGSTDDTPQVAQAYAEAHPGRIRYIRQDNAGYVAATNRALSEATGELWAMLDADDLWAPEKTARQAELFRDNPRLCLAYTDLEVIDPDDAVVEPSFLGKVKAPPLAGPGTLPTFLSWGNVATGSSVMVRAALGTTLAPIPAEMPYVDWWLAARAADAGEVAFVDAPLVGYRQHGGNLTLAASGEALVREKIKGASARRCLLARCDIRAFSVEQLVESVRRVNREAIGAVEAAQTAFVPFPQPTVAAREAAARVAARARRLQTRGHAREALAHWVRAWALDPFDRAVYAELTALTQAIGQGIAPSGDVLDDARGFVTLADAEEVVAAGELLAAYAAAFGAADDATLVIDAEALEPEAIAERVGGAVAGAGLDAEGGPDLLAVPRQLAEQRAELLARADALLTTRAADGGPPAFGPGDGEALRALADETLALLQRH